jgi:hypothetical protein
MEILNAPHEIAVPAPTRPNSEFAAIMQDAKLSVSDFVKTESVLLPKIDLNYDGHMDRREIQQGLKTESFSPVERQTLLLMNEHYGMIARWGHYSDESASAGISMREINPLSQYLLSRNPAELAASTKESIAAPVSLMGVGGAISGFGISAALEGVILPSLAGGTLVTGGAALGLALMAGSTYYVMKNVHQSRLTKMHVESEKLLSQLGR